MNLRTKVEADAICVTEIVIESHAPSAHAVTSLLAKIILKSPMFVTIASNLDNCETMCTKHSLLCTKLI